MLTAFVLKYSSLKNDTAVSAPSFPNLIPRSETGDEKKRYLHNQNYVSNFLVEALLQLLFTSGIISKEIGALFL